MFSTQKNKWSLGVKSNFENFEFWVVPNFKYALVTTTVHQFQKSRLVLCMIFNQEIELCVQAFFTWLLKNSIFLHSEAWLSSIMQNWNKLLSFLNCVPEWLTNFECPILKLHTLNYHNTQAHHWMPLRARIGLRSPIGSMHMAFFLGGLSKWTHPQSCWQVGWRVHCTWNFQVE